MNYRNNNYAKLHISEIVLGSWVFGAKNWGQVNDEDSKAVIKEAISMGINTIDTAPIYGFGHAEEVLGETIKSSRDRIILATKCGLKQEAHGIAHDLSPSFIEEELLNSLKRLQTDYIDIYQIHWPDPAVDVRKAVEVLAKYKDKGAIRHIGLCNHNLEQIKKACEIAEIGFLQNPYSLLNKQIEDEVLPFAKEKGLGVFAYGVLHGGLLTGKYKEKPVVSKKDAKSFFYAIDSEKSWEEYKKLGKIDPPKAISWVLENKAITGAILGCRNLKQLHENLK